MGKLEMSINYVVKLKFVLAGGTLARSMYFRQMYINPTQGRATEVPSLEN